MEMSFLKLHIGKKNCSGHYGRLATGGTSSENGQKIKLEKTSFAKLIEHLNRWAGGWLRSLVPFMARFMPTKDSRGLIR